MTHVDSITPAPPSVPETEHESSATSLPPSDAHSPHPSRKNSACVTNASDASRSRTNSLTIPKRFDPLRRNSSASFEGSLPLLSNPADTTGSSNRPVPVPPNGSLGSFSFGAVDPLAEKFREVHDTGVPADDVFTISTMQAEIRSLQAQLRMAQAREAASFHVSRPPADLAPALPALQVGTAKMTGVDPQKADGYSFYADLATDLRFLLDVLSSAVFTLQSHAKHSTEDGVVVPLSDVNLLESLLSRIKAELVARALAVPRDFQPLWSEVLAFIAGQGEAIGKMSRVAFAVKPAVIASHIDSAIGVLNYGVACLSRSLDSLTKGNLAAASMRTTRPPAPKRSGPGTLETDRSDGVDAALVRSMAEDILHLQQTVTSLGAAVLSAREDDISASRLAAAAATASLAEGMMIGRDFSNRMASTTPPPGYYLPPGRRMNPSEVALFSRSQHVGPQDMAAFGVYAAMQHSRLPAAAPHFPPLSPYRLTDPMTVPASVPRYATPPLPRRSAGSRLGDTTSLYR